MLMRSMVGGDPPSGYKDGGAWVNDGEEFFDATNVLDDGDNERESEDYLDPFHDIQQQLFNAFDVGDNLRTELTPDDCESDGTDDLDFERMTAKLDQLEELCR
jgi:hypothetical protein